jgi:lysozyme family protein
VTLASVTAQDPLAGFCIAKTLPLEGGFVDAPDDSGGPTKYGVSLRWALLAVKASPTLALTLDHDHSGHVDHRDIQGLTQDEAADAYFEGFWLGGWYERLAPEIIAWKAFDIAVNTGPKRSALILQNALCSVGRAVSVDAQVGPQTVGAVAAERAFDNGARLLAAMRVQQAKFYRRIVSLSDGKLDKFLAGWLKRAAV